MEHALLIAPHVQRNDAVGVACDQPVSRFRVNHDERVHPSQLIEPASARILRVQGQQHFAIAARLKRPLAQAGPKVLVVDDLPIRGEHVAPVWTRQWLSAARRVHDGEAFMGDGEAVIAVRPRPIRATMAHLTRGFDGRGPGLGFRTSMVEDGKNGAHEMNVAAPTAFRKPCLHIAPPMAAEAATVQRHGHGRCEL